MSMRHKDHRRRANKARALAALKSEADLAEQAGEIPSMEQQNLFTALSDMSPNRGVDLAGASPAQVQRVVGQTESQETK